MVGRNQVICHSAFERDRQRVSGRIFALPLYLVDLCVRTMQLVSSTGCSEGRL